MIVGLCCGGGHSTPKQADSCGFGAGVSGARTAEPVHVSGILERISEDGPGPDASTSGTPRPNPHPVLTDRRGGADSGF